VLHRLAEADAGVDHDAILADAGGLCGFRPSGEGGTYVDEDGVRRSSVTLGPATGMSLHA